MRGSIVCRGIACGLLLACNPATKTSGTDPTPVLAGVVISPASALIEVGDSVAFTAVGRLSDGSTMDVAVYWSTTGGSVSRRGVYQTTGGIGSYGVIASTLDGQFADTAPVTVSLRPPPGGAVLLSEGFEDGFVSDRGWYDNVGPVISTTEHHGGTASLEMSWQALAKLPVHGGAMRHKFTGSDRVYLSYWVKYSANYVGSGQDYHPHEFHFVTDQDHDYVGPSTTHLTTYVEINYRNGGIPLLSVTDVANIDQARSGQDLTTATEQRAVAGCNGNTDGYATDCYGSPGAWRNEKHWRAGQVTFAPTPGPGYKGDWHRVEAYFQLNTIQSGTGQTDGIAQYWFDGQLIIDKRNVLFRTGAFPTMKFNQFIIAPYIGDGSPVAQSMWVDDLVIATSRGP